MNAVTKWQSEWMLSKTIKLESTSLERGLLTPISRSAGFFRQLQVIGKLHRQSHNPSKDRTMGSYLSIAVGVVIQVPKCETRREHVKHVDPSQLPRSVPGIKAWQAMTIFLPSARTRNQLRMRRRQPEK